MRNQAVLFLLLTSCFVPELRAAKTTTVSPDVLDKHGVTGIVALTIVALTILLLMTIFGHRMRYSGIRWFTVNICFWGYMHMIYVTGYWKEKAPFFDWFDSQLWRDNGDSFEALGRSIFPLGAIFIAIEQSIITVVPFLEDNPTFNIIFAISHLVVTNGIIIVVTATQIPYRICDMYEEVNNKCYWFYPIDMMGIYVFGIYVCFTILYFIWCLIGCCLCCAKMASASPSQSPSTFVNMWLVYLFIQFPVLLFGPSISMDVFKVVTQKLMDWIIEHGYMSLIMGGGVGGLNLGPLISIASNLLSAMPWFIPTFPLIEATMIIFCFDMYREQFFFLITCGKMYVGKPEKKKKKKKFPPVRTGTVIYPKAGVSLILSPAQLQTPTVEKQPAPTTPPDPIHVKTE